MRNCIQLYAIAATKAFENGTGQYKK